jgi:hypothetical protein
LSYVALLACPRLAIYRTVVMDGCKALVEPTLASHRRAQGQMWHVGKNWAKWFDLALAVLCRAQKAPALPPNPSVLHVDIDPSRQESFGERVPRVGFLFNLLYSIIHDPVWDKVFPMRIDARVTWANESFFHILRKWGTKHSHFSRYYSLAIWCSILSWNENVHRTVLEHVAHGHSMLYLRVATMEVATETSGVAAERSILFGQETTVDLT